MKRPAHSITLLLALMAVFTACHNKEVGSHIPIINFEATEEKEFDVSEILQDPKLVRLETNEKSLLERARYAPGEKYIIAVSGDAILQFTGEGRFIRVLAQRGGGPQEFQGISAFAMNDKEEKLYVDHTGRKTGIMVFDLNSGDFDGIIEKPLEALNLEKGFSIDKMMVVNDSIYGIIERDNTSESGLYMQRTSGELLTAFPRDDKASTANVTARPFLARVTATNEIRYKSRDLDTLFSISGRTKEPYAAITYEDKFLYEPDVTQLTGNMMAMLGEGRSGILFQKLIATAKGNIASLALEGVYFTNKAGFKTLKISRLMMNELEFPSTVYWGRGDDTMYLAMPAVLFKEMLQSAIEKSAGNAQSLERWQSLDEQISENDNPVLVMGKMK